MMPVDSGTSNIVPLVLKAMATPAASQTSR